MDVREVTRRVWQAIGCLWRPSTYLRWVYLLLGAALVLAFILVDSALGAVVSDLDLPKVATGLIWVLLALLPPIVLGLLPAVREVEGIAVESLLAVRFEERPLGPARTWAQRRRTTVWFCLHLLAGGVVGILSTIVFGLGAIWLAAPFRSPGSRDIVPGWSYDIRGGWSDLWMPAAAIGGLAGLFLLSAAARRVLASDPEFAETALAAMETSARAALADLDHVLGLLRDDRRPGSRTAPEATLGGLDRLVEATRAGGITVEVERSGELDRLPAAVSREAYRIVQEGLTNAIRHAGRPAGELTVHLSICLDASGLRLAVTNPVSGKSDHSGGGRGLAGIRERVAVLRGTVDAGPITQAAEPGWQLAVRLPVSVTKG